MSKALKGRVFTKEHIKNMSLSRLGKPRSEETKKKISNYRKGRKLSEKHKESIRQAALKRHNGGKQKT